MYVLTVTKFWPKKKNLEILLNAFRGKMENDEKLFE